MYNALGLLALDLERKTVFNHSELLAILLSTRSNARFSSPEQARKFEQICEAFHNRCADASKPIATGMGRNQFKKWLDDTIIQLSVPVQEPIKAKTIGIPPWEEPIKAKTIGIPPWEEPTEELSTKLRLNKIEKEVEAILEMLKGVADVLSLLKMLGETKIP